MAFQFGSAKILWASIPVSCLAEQLAILRNNPGVETQARNQAFTMGDSVLLSLRHHCRAISMKLASFLPPEDPGSSAPSWLC